MSCHLSCPTCQNKFFKISNMSTTNSKRDFLKINLSQKLKKSTSSDLELARYENVQLGNQNRTLRNDINELRVKNENLVKALDLNQERFEEDFIKLQEEIRKNESHLVDNSRKCLEQQKRNAEEIRRLKQENEDLKNSRAEAEKSLSDKLRSLENEINLLKVENKNLRTQSIDSEQRNLKYKTKLKHAVKIVNDMNQIVVQYRNKPEITCGTTQTDYEYTGDNTSIKDCFQCGDPRYKSDLNTENLILSDIFFKPKSFLDSEMDLFAVKSKYKMAMKN